MNPELIKALQAVLATDDHDLALQLAHQECEWTTVRNIHQIIDARNNPGLVVVFTKPDLAGIVWLRISPNDVEYYDGGVPVPALYARKIPSPYAR